MNATIGNRFIVQEWMIHAAAGAILAAGAAAFFFGFYAPSGHDVARHRRQMNEIQTLTGSQQQVADQHVELSQRLARLKGAVAATQRRIPSRSPAQEFIERASQLATHHGLQMEFCTASASQSFPTHSQIEVNCRLAGGYASVGRFLAAVDQLPQISQVTRLEISSQPDSQSYPAQVAFQLYYWSDLHDTELKRGAR